MDSSFLDKNGKFIIKSEDKIDLTREVESFRTYWKEHYQYDAAINSVLEKLDSATKNLLEAALKRMYNDLVTDDLEIALNEKMQTVANDAYQCGKIDSRVLDKNLVEKAKNFKKDVETYMRERDGY